MIAYFDTSAILPLIIDEPASDVCSRLWNDAARVVSVRLLYPEASAALAAAERMQRVTRRQLRAAIAELESIITQVDHLEITALLARDAGELAQTHGLRGYDAVHLAAAAAAIDDELVLVTGDSDLGIAATSLGIAVAITTNDERIRIPQKQTRFGTRSSTATPTMTLDPSAMLRGSARVRAPSRAVVDGGTTFPSRVR